MVVRDPAWFARGIRSIICLLGPDHLPLYDGLPGGLVAHYRENGLEVAHVPVNDHRFPPLAEDQFQDVWAAYQRLPKSVLVHCSAGVDRTGAAIDHIQRKLKVLGT